MLLLTNAPCIDEFRTMETHRYQRKKPTSGTFDAYDCLAFDYPQAHSNLEYWTNGTTTHLNVMSTRSSEAEQLPSRSHRGNSQISKRSSNTTISDGNVVRNSILAGSIAGIVSTTAVYPFDVVRTKMQAAAQQVGRSMGPMQAFSETYAHGGMRALYTGLSLPLTAQAVYKATIFATNTVCQSALIDYRTFENLKRGKRKQHKLTLSDYFMCGFVGGAINAALFVTPVEFVRNQLIVQHTKLAGMDASAAATKTLSGPFDVIRSTVSSQGVSGLWRGLGMTVARDSLGCGGFFVAMACCRQLFTPKGEQPTWGVTVLSGACAGVGFWVIALPLDTVKTWVQNGTAESASLAIQEAVHSHGYLRTAHQLCRGWQVAFGRGAPSAAITIGTYEYFYQKMETL